MTHNQDWCYDVVRCRWDILPLLPTLSCACLAMSSATAYLILCVSGHVFPGRVGGTSYGGEVATNLLGSA